MAVVWAFKRLPVLEGQTGYVDVPDALAKELVEAGEAQDPYGSEELKFITDEAPAVAAQAVPGAKPQRAPKAAGTTPVAQASVAEPVQRKARKAAKGDQSGKSKKGD